MAGEWETFDVWVGRFPSAAAVEGYFKETHTGEEDNPPISRFAAEVGTWFYDHDFMEYTFHDPPVLDFAAAVRERSFATSYASPAVKAFEAAPLVPFNLVLVISGDQIDTPVSVASSDHVLQYLGRFECDTAAE
jgi:hypothetical protein